MATPAEILNVNDRESADYKERQTVRLWQMIGASKLANQLAVALSAQRLRAFEQIRDEKLYLAAGYETFKDFLDQHPESDLSYDQFNRRIKLLETEGDVVFDLLSSLNVSLKDRKLLAGQIEVEGNEIRVGDTRVRKDDEAGILNLITTQHAKMLEQQRTIERGRKDVEKLKRRADDAEKRAVHANPTGTPSGQALLTAAGALAQLREALEAAPDEEKQALREHVFELLRMNQLECSVALGVVKREEVPGGDEYQSEGSEEINDEELEGMDS